MTAQKTHSHVRQVVPLKQMTLEELASHDGSDPSKPLYLAVKGTVFDVSKGSQFYGPDGACCFLFRLSKDRRKNELIPDAWLF